MRDRVHFPGFQVNPCQWFHHADLFVLASRYEGLPNALLEALASGCPAVVTACPGGSYEVARHVGEDCCRLVRELPWQFPEMGNATPVMADLMPFRAERAASDFATVFSGDRS